MKKSLGFIGAGKSTRIILNAIDNRKLKFRRVVLADVNPIVVENLRNHYPFVESESASIAAGQGVVFLGMENEIFMDTLGLVSGDFRENAIIISLAPDINFARLALRLQNSQKVARVLVPPSAYTNEAYIPVSFSPGFPDTDKDDILDLFGNFGKAIEVQEDKLQTYSTTSAVLTSYFWYQSEEIMKMGRELGLTPEETIDLMNESLRSSLYFRYRSGLKEEQLQDILQVRPAEENESESYRRRLVELYRKEKPVPSKKV
jgi:pyrroline-5-carboxylate reductase